MVHYAVGGDVFIPYFNLAIFVDTSSELRIRRIKQREYNKLGNRILLGRALRKEWMKKLKCPVITVDGELPIDYLISQIGEIIKKLDGL